MRVGVVFHENLFERAPGVDLVRLRAIAGGLNNRGVKTEIIAPVDKPGVWEDGLLVRPLDVLNDRPERYDLLKTSYHHSIRLIGRFRGPVVSRLVRIVDQVRPKHDERQRAELLACQAEVAGRAQAVALNNEVNKERWLKHYGRKQEIVLTPTGCPAELPPLGKNPYRGDKPVILFLGSASAGRMIEHLNGLAERLADRAEVHLIGRNKTELYGEYRALSPRIIQHGQLPEAETWDFIRHADLGLALAYGPDPFENDIAKIINYLRGGLPVLAEERLIQNELIAELAMGRFFAYGDLDDLTAKARALLSDPPPFDRAAAARYAAENHSWESRVEVYLKLFERLTG